MVEESDFEGNKVENGLPVDDPSLTLAAVFIGLINIILLLFLLFTYILSYRKLKSRFSLGLVLFALLLLLQNAIFIFFLLSREGFHGPGMGGPVLSINVIQLGALLVLLKIASF